LHPPQLVRFAEVGVSQPFDALPSQLAQPALQLPIVHTPPEQAPAAFGGAHA
jgi:hypothetical protein